VCKNLKKLRADFDEILYRGGASHREDSIIFCGYPDCFVDPGSFFSGFVPLVEHKLTLCSCISTTYERIFMKSFGWVGHGRSGHFSGFLIKFLEG